MPLEFLLEEIVKMASSYRQAALDSTLSIEDELSRTFFGNRFLNRCVSTNF